MTALVTPFFDEPTFTFSYIVQDPDSNSCAIIDSVLDFDYDSGTTNTRSADQMLAHIQQNNLQLEWILETHVHADHLSAAPYLKQQVGGKTGIGEHIQTVQSTFGKVFNAGTEFARDGSQFDQLFKDGDQFQIGSLTAKAIHTPGHTPACMTYQIGDCAFVGDTLFMPDFGTARCDFPGGDAGILFQSIQKIFALPGETRLFMCHDYKAPGREQYAWETTVAEERQNNIHVGHGISQQDFEQMRSERDKTLGMPRLILPSVQVNMRAGQMPPAEDNGQVYLKVPLNLF
ncbi:MBL fold metallo-hydrolase [Motiliproteus coralliicola]|uniref:MBL fold metallo-hydrolase n=1 Tax=Motiliproteus coralliicola TaxID=2283196 RepID=A0A369WCM1_9GAMM|nr:MBL fold metallo-hydrolase [Motiliproteus coralliicola]RDE19081.1 MBL fold metallo-hydrolase [Motiliproteus coralliicola]